LTVRKRSRLTHMQESQRMASFPHLNPYPILEVDKATGRIIYTNPAVSKTLRKLKVKNDPRVFLPGDIKDILKDKAIKRTNTPVYREVTIADRVFSEQILRVPGMDTVRMYVTEATEKNRLQERLRFEGQLLDSATDSIFVHDFNQRCVYVNETAYKSRGYTKEEILKIKIKNLVAPEYRQLIDERVDRLQKEGQDLTYGSIHIRKDGSVYPVEIHSRIIETLGKRYVLAVIRDVSHRYDVDMVVKRGEDTEDISTNDNGVNEHGVRETIEQHERDLADAQKIAHIGSWSYDMKTKRVEWSDELFRIFGMDPRKGAPSWPEGHRRLFHPDDWEWTAKEVQKAIRNGQNYEFQERFLKSDGSTGYLDVRTEIQRNKNGRPLKIVGTAQDVTERMLAERKLEETVDQLKKALSGTVDALAITSEIRDPYTSGHEKRVSFLAQAIAGELGLNEADIEKIRITGILHDIGKIYVPTEILSKPGRLTDVEFELVKAHPTLGSEIVGKATFPWPVDMYILQHHERLDGSGYPKGLKGNKISIEARILGVADVVEAMSSHRPYREALGLEKALKEISANKGKLYDLEVVDACIRLFTEKGFNLEDLEQSALDCG